MTLGTICMFIIDRFIVVVFYFYLNRQSLVIEDQMHAL